jgi:hypothetical protein
LAAGALAYAAIGIALLLVTGDRQAKGLLRMLGKKR